MVDVVFVVVDVIINPFPTAYNEFAAFWRGLFNICPFIFKVSCFVIISHKTRA